MPTEIGTVIDKIEQTRNDIAQIIRDSGSYIAPNTKLKDLVPYVRSLAQPVQRKDTDVTVDGATVTIPFGYYGSDVQKSVASGSATTPDTTITANPSLTTTYTTGSGYKMTVSKTQSVTPSVSAGYVSSGTAGTITVSGSAYVPRSSTGSATASTTDAATRNIGYGQQTTIGAGYYPTDRIVRNSVAAGSATTPTDTITATNEVTIDDDGLITATASGSKSITPTVEAGYVSAGTAGTVSVSGTGTRQLTKRTSSDLIVSGAKVTAPAGYYPNPVDTSIPNASLPTPTFTAQLDDDIDGAIWLRASVSQSEGYTSGGTVLRDVYPTLTVSGDTATMECEGAKVTRKVASATQATPSITVSSDGLITASATQTAGHVSAGTQSTTEQLTTQAGKTVTPTTSDQTAVASGRYTTGAITVKGDSNLVAGNIKKGFSIFGVEGTYEGTGGASIATCNVKVKFTTDPGNCLTSATTFSNGTVTVFNSTTKSGEFTISNVICGSALSINTTYMVSLYWSGSKTDHNSLVGGTITVPATAGTYTVEVGVVDD